MNPIRPFHARARNAWRATLLAGLACVGVVLVAACGAGSAAKPHAATAPAVPPPAPSTAPAPPSPPPAATATAVPPPAPSTAPAPPSPPATAQSPLAPTAASLPAYQPSQVVSSGAGSAYLVSPDPVGKVSGFYIQVLSKDGWQLVSKHVSSHGAELVGKRQAQGARVQIFSDGHGSTILVASSGAA